MENKIIKSKKGFGPLLIIAFWALIIYLIIGVIYFLYYASIRTWELKAIILWPLFIGFRLAFGQGF